jgi:hypothetical protein
MSPAIEDGVLPPVREIGLFEIPARPAGRDARLHARRDAYRYFGGLCAIRFGRISAPVTRLTSVIES